MDISLISISVVWIFLTWVATCKSQITNCTSENFVVPTCCYNYSETESRQFNIICPEETHAITIVDVVHLFGTSYCGAGDVPHNCSISNNNIAWRAHLSDETCLTTSNICMFEIPPVQAGDDCNENVHYEDWSDAVVLKFNCIDASVSTTFTTSTNFVSTNTVTTSSQRNEPKSTPNTLSSSTSNYGDDTSISHFDDVARTSHFDEDSYSSVITSDLPSKPLSSTTPESRGNMTGTPKPAAQQSSAAGAIGGGIAAAVIVIVIVILIIFLLRRRKLQEKKNNFNNEKSNSNEHTYTDVDYSKTSPHKSKYEEANATQEKDFPLKHCDSHETSHYCYVGSNECHGKGHTNDEEKPQYDNVENMTYDAPKTNRVDKQDQNHYDNINEEVENKNNERIDLYAVPNKAKTGVSGDNNKMSLKRNMDGSEYSIYPTLPAKCFDTLAEDPDRPKYAEIDMEKSGISASSRKNVDAKPSEDLNYAQIQF